MNKQKVYRVTLDEEQIVALGNLFSTLLENQNAMEHVPDALDECGTPSQTLWEGIQPGLPALRALVSQLPM